MKHESKIWGIVAAVITMVLLFLFLWFYYLDKPYLPEEEGIEVALGDYVEGVGGEMTEPHSGVETPQPVETEPVQTAPAPVPSAPSTNDLMVQEDEEALALKKQAEEERKRKAAEEALREKQRKEELARIEAERIAAEKAAAEKAAKEQAAKDKAKNLMAGAFGNNSSEPAGSGTTSGTTHQGTPAGNPASGGSVSGGPKVSLVGRNLRGKLATPTYDTNEEGVVVVRIQVNAEGKVVSATKGQGTNTSSQALINAAINAAKQATFSAADKPDAPDVYGTITYQFKNK
ncbi:MAG: TonB family protein [Paludibacteraceae bacterium]|nr:TonB family protein [Paludibacteraceae bacterium]